MDAAHVEVIEQRAALRHQAELIAIEHELVGHDLIAGAIELLALEQDPREGRLAGARAAEQHHPQPADVERGRLRRQGRR